MPEALCCSIFCALLPDHSYLVEKLSVPDLIEVAVAEPSTCLQSRTEEFEKWSCLLKLRTFKPLQISAVNKQSSRNINIK